MSDTVLKASSLSGTDVSAQFGILITKNKL